MNTALRVLFVTPECAPWIKTGGLGDVSAALPAALGALGHDVRVLMPAYAPLRPLITRNTQRIELPAWGRWPAAALVAVQAEGFTLWLLDCPALYDRAGPPYGDEKGRDHPDNARRFGLLSHVAARIASVHSPWPDWQAQVLHGHDWPAGLAPAYLRQMDGPRAVSVFTIHNLAFQGNFSAEWAAALALPHEWLNVDGLLHWNQISMMKAALRYSDAITTVSPTYAQEIQQEALGFGLDGMLRHRADALHGILNGIDTQAWNPALDARIAARYSAGDLGGKRLNKAALQRQMDLPLAPDALLFGMVSRLTEQKGIDLVLDNLPWFTGQRCQLVVLGSGEPRLEHALQAAAKAHPATVAVCIGFDETLAHLIEAGADCFLMPSRFEPCGLNQMYSLAYGTLPLVRATGGLADSVCDARQPGGTGFVFDDATPAALQHTLARALQTYGQPAQWQQLQQAAMSQRFGWETSAARYVDVYRGALQAQGSPRIAP